MFLRRKKEEMVMLCEQYRPSIERDPCYVQYLDKIAQIFFDVEPPRRQSAGLFGNLIQSFLNGLDDDSDDDMPQASTSRVMQSELD